MKTTTLKADDMSLDIDYLRTLCESTGVSGFEEEVCQNFLSYLKDKTDTPHIDTMGNAITFLKGNGEAQTVMIEAHADEIGFQVIHINDMGNIFIRPNGGIDEQCLPGSQVLIQTQTGELIPGVIGKKPIHLMKADDRKHTIEAHHLWVDTGIGKDESRVNVGDPVAFAPNMKLMGKHRVTSKALDDRIGVFVVAQAMRRLAMAKSLERTIAGVATTQEEVGCRGSVTASYTIQPDIAITVDVDFATDVPDCPSSQYGEIALGKGVVIPRNADADMTLSRKMEQLAKAKGIPYQISARHRATGGTNASKIQLTRDGVRTLSLGIPCRYMHTPVEMCDLRDVEAAIQLIVEFCTEEK